MKKNQRLPRPILTPSTKAAKGDHDVSVSREELLAMGRIDPDVFDRAADDRRDAVRRGPAPRRRRGPDPRRHQVRDRPRRRDRQRSSSSTRSTRRTRRATGTPSDYEERLARGEEPRSLDKEYVRRWLADEAKWTGDGPPPVMPDESASRPRAATSRATSSSPARRSCPTRASPIARIAAALGAA